MQFIRVPYQLGIFIASSRNLLWLTYETEMEFVSKDAAVAYRIMEY